MVNPLLTLFYMVAAHALFDFPLQGDAVATNKNRNLHTELQKHVPWFYWLGSHAIVHGAGVAILTHSLMLGMFETIAHFIIDFFKCEKFYSIHVDQFLHIWCKVVWLEIAVLVLN